MRVSPSVVSLSVFFALAACDAPSSSSEPAEPVGAVPETPAPPVASAPSEPAAAALPMAFQGVWDRSAAACLGPAGELRLTVEPAALRFYEGVARVAAVRPVGVDALEVDTLRTGEGSSEPRRYRLALRQGGLVVAVDGAEVERVRCAPDASPA